MRRRRVPASTRTPADAVDLAAWGALDNIALPGATEKEGS